MSTNRPSDLPGIAEQLTERARQAPLSAADLQAACPWLHQQIVQDKAAGHLFDLWGRSSNFDELAQREIVEPGVLAAIGEVAGVSMNGRIVHAGLQHTYGYLLSTIVTPFGYKRDRWVSSHLEQGFGLPPDILGPCPSAGTLLSNATLFAGSIAFRGDLPALRTLCAATSIAATVLGNLDWDRLPQTRLVESLTARDSAGRFRSVSINTDLVPLPRQDLSGDPWLLVYSIRDSSRPGPQLVTLFTVTNTFVTELTAPSRMGKREEIKPRFNATIAGLPATPLMGRRVLQEIRA